MAAQKPKKPAKKEAGTKKAASTKKAATTKSGKPKKGKIFSTTPRSYQKKEAQKNEDIKRAIRKVNDSLKRAGNVSGYLKADLLGTLQINFGDYLTPSGRLSMSLASSGQPELLERLEALNNYIKAKIHEYKNIPDDIYKWWQKCIKEYFAFVSELGLETLEFLAPATTKNIDALTKDSAPPEFFLAYNIWLEERRNILVYINRMRNTMPFTDDDFM